MATRLRVIDTMAEHLGENEVMGPASVEGGPTSKERAQTAHRTNSATAVGVGDGGPSGTATKQPDQVDELIEQLGDRFKIDTNSYRRDILRSRIAQWMADHRPDPDAGDVWLTRLVNSNLLMDELCQAVFVGQCRFLSRKDVKKIFPDQVIENLFKHPGNEKPIRVWIVGCGSGEESYSLTVQLSKCAAKHNFTGKLKILATDVCRPAVRTAIRGTYDQSAVNVPNGVAQERHFKCSENGRWKITDTFRRHMVIARHDVLNEAPFSRLDVIVCRGVISDMVHSARDQVLEKFHYALAPDGILILGKNENAPQLRSRFESIPGSPTVFRKKDIDSLAVTYQTRGLTPNMKPPTSVGTTSRVGHVRNLLSAYDELLNAYVQSGYLVNDQGELLHSIGNASKYLDSLNGLVSLNIIDLVHPNMRGVITTAFARGMRGFSGVVFESAICDIDGDRQSLRVTVQPLSSRIGDGNPLFIGLTQAAREGEAVTVSSESEGPGLNDSDQDCCQALEEELATSKNECAAVTEQCASKTNELKQAECALQAVSEELLSTQQELQAVSEELSSVEAEHRATASQLTQLTQDFDTLVNNSEVAVLFLDNQCNVRTFTPAINRMFGIRKMDIGRPIDEIPRRFNWQDPIADTQSVLQTGDVIENEVFDVGGEAYFLRLSRCQSNHDDSLGIMVELQSIETVRRAESALQIGATNQWRLLDAVADAIWVTSPTNDGTGQAYRVDHVNPAFSQMWGMTGQDLKQNPDAWLKNVHTDDFERIRAALDELPAGEQPTLRYRITRPDDSLCWIEHRILTMRGAGSMPDRIAHIAHDLTDRKTADKRFSEFIANAHVATALVTDGMITMANRQLAEMTGQSIGDIEGRAIDEIVRCTSDSCANVLGDSPSAPGSDGCVDAQIIKRDGGQVPVEIHWGPVDTVEGPAVLANFHDLTKLRQAEARVRHANMRLQRSIEELDEFTYVASHDLREPLRKVSAFSQLLPQDIPMELPKRAQDDVGYIVEGAKRMQSLIDGLLELTRCGKNESTDQSVAVRECVDAALDALETRISEANAEVVIDDLPVVVGNKALITCVYVNLIDNALKHANPEKDANIHITATQRDVWVFGVRDNGMGIDPRYAQRIFAPFKRLQSNTEIESAGMGLPICRKIVRQHGGSIWVESALGQGAHFMFTLSDAME